MRRVLLLIFLLILPLDVWAGSRISGKATYESDSVRSRAGGGSASTYTLVEKHFELLGVLDGKMLGGRLGEYRFDVGYEWLGVETGGPGASFAADGDKALYNMELEIAPGALPFRLDLWVRDMSRVRARAVRPSYSLVGKRNLDGSDTDNFRTFNDVTAGTHREYGAQLIVGIKNGSYLGKYRDALSRFPRLMIDFNEQRVKSQGSVYREDYKITNLAFISLNKKDNWLHYRMQKYDNFIDSTRNSAVERVTLGTIDYADKRQWINLTNWVKLSADFNYEIQTSPLQAIPKEQSYALNVMTDARMSHYYYALDLQYQRVDNSVTREEEVTVPLISHNGWWRAGGRYTAINKLNFDSGGQTQTDHIYAYLNTKHKKNGFKLEPNLALETKSESAGSSYTAGRIGIKGNRGKGTRSVITFDSYVTVGSQAGGVVQEKTYTDLMLEAGFEHQGGVKSYTSLSNRFQVGSGESVGVGAAVLRPHSALAGGGQNFVNDTMFAHGFVLGEVVNRVDFSHSFRSIDDQARSRASYRAELTQGIKTWKVQSVYNRSQSDDNTAGNYIAENFAVDGKLLINHSARAHSTWALAAEEEHRGALKTRETEAKQSFSYLFLASQGRARKIADIMQEFGYLKRDIPPDKIDSVMQLSVDANYYPTTHTRFGGGLNIREEESKTATTLRALAEVNYPLFTARVTYSYTEQSTVVESTEERVSLLLEKRL